jgi:hypothetical protein
VVRSGTRLGRNDTVNFRVSEVNPGPVFYGNSRSDFAAGQKPVQRGPAFRFPVVMRAAAAGEKTKAGKGTKNI